MYLYDDQFRVDNDFPFFQHPKKTLIIASTGRSGSHMLGHALMKTKSLGCPLEYLNPSNLPKWNKRFNTNNLEDTLNKIKHHRTSTNGVFSIKMHYTHLKQIHGN